MEACDKLYGYAQNGLAVNREYFTKRLIATSAVLMVVRDSAESDDGREAMRTSGEDTIGAMRNRAVVLAAACGRPFTDFETALRACITSEGCIMYKLRVERTVDIARIAHEEMSNALHRSYALMEQFDASGPELLKQAAHIYFYACFLSAAFGQVDPFLQGMFESETARHSAAA